MKISLLSYLTCATCGGSFVLDAKEREEDTGEVMEGTLTCSCSTFPIRNGIPRMVSQATDEHNWKTAERFGEEWRQFSMLTPEYEAQFLSWIEPIKAEYFKNKVVLDAGCGKGRHMVQALKFGAKEVIGIDLSHAVDTAYAHLGKDPRVHIIQADIFHLPFKPVFEYIYSIGVLHHTPDPAQAFSSLTKLLAPGGGISAWVYGREGNGWIIYVLNPIRWITARLPLVLTKGLAFVFACILQGLLRTLYRPLSAESSWQSLQKRLPYAAYLCSIAPYTFRENFSIVFDHLLPAIAYYIPEGEFRKWFKEAGLQEVSISQRYANSWRGYGKKIK